MPVPATLRKAAFRTFDQARAFARVLSGRQPLFTFLGAEAVGPRWVVTYRVQPRSRWFV